ncbi:hypothetical protein Lesp02_54240 [Lentzea sp. NBRC 105346]|uniref:hypothetical protein n=1 Tax=Lentzea sp. NBRC 105346 TaxID=3032205 RepID=UPI0024A276FA|nr:hypothetical protein [Lentzea sp. NBRC 105346]GLZ33236.1 hypothetical protein Lesp02_54240 [Lentzea sp. NBRC 105346]
MELFSLDTDVQGVRKWTSDDAHMGFVYRKQPIDFRLKLGNTTGRRQDKADVSFKLEYLDGEGDIIIQGEGWTCQGDAFVNTCKSDVPVETGAAWPDLPFTMHHSKGGQTQVTITWGNVTKYVVFRWDTST